MPVDPSIIAAGVGAATTIGSTAYNSAQVGKTNLKSRQFAESMYQWQRNDALADWNRQNEYNSPTQQMKRLKEAGLNPNLIYGNGNATAISSSQPRGSNAPAWTPHAPQVDPGAIGEVVSKYFDTKIKQAQYDNLVATKENIDADTAQKRSTTENIGIKSNRAQFDLDLEKELRDLTIQTRLYGTAKIKQEVNNMFSANQRAEISNSQSIAESVERVLLMKKREGQITWDNQRIQATTANIKADTQIKEAELLLRKQGFTSSTPQFQRLIGKIVNNLSDIPDVPKTGGDFIKKSIFQPLWWMGSH